MMKYGGKVIHIDPVSQEADYSTMLKADIILVTHEHGDHLDAKAIDQISTSKTSLIVTKSVFEKIKKGTVVDEKRGQHGCAGAEDRGGAGL